MDNTTATLHALHTLFASRLALLHKLLEQHSPADIWGNLVGALEGTRIQHATRDALINQRRALSIEKCVGMLPDDIALLRRTSNDYPQLLAQVEGAPWLLYCRGSLAQLSSQPIAIIGSRKCSSYGADVATTLASNIARAGHTVVSGLAYGIDACAAEGALRGGGSSIAVLAGGVDAASVYPRAHAQLAERILAAGGALLSEYPPGTRPRKEYFLHRNRIVAWMSQSLVVVEAAARSGSLTTARWADLAGRDVYAVPGPITSATSAGTNELIARGAAILTSCDAFTTAVEYTVSPASPQERIVLELLRTRSYSVNELIAESGINAAHVQSILSIRSLDGTLHYSQGHYRLNSNICLNDTSTP